MSTHELSFSSEAEEAIKEAAHNAGMSVPEWLAEQAIHNATIQNGLAAVAEYEAEHGAFTEEELRWAREAVEEDRRAVETIQAARYQQERKAS